MNDAASDSAPLLGLACVLVFGATLAGAFVPSLFRLSHTRLQVGVSFSAGLMLGLALLGMLPHAMLSTQNVQAALNWMVGGFLATFFLQRLLHYHHHEIGQTEAHTGHDPGHCCHSPASVRPQHTHAQRVAWLGVLLGLALHSVMDGVAIGASLSLAKHGHGHALGLGTALAVLMHKPFDAFALATLMLFSGVKPTTRTLVNVGFALVTPLGAILAFAGAAQWLETHPTWLGYALGFCAGTFLCIACADLLPELQFHRHDRILLSLALALGVLVALLISTTCHHHHAQPHLKPPEPVDHTHGVGPDHTDPVK